MPKNNPITAPKPSYGGARSNAMPPHPDGPSVFTKGKAAFKRFHNRILPNSVPKEATTENQPTGTVVIKELAEGQGNEGPALVNTKVTTALHPDDLPVVSPALALMGDGGLPALSHQCNEPAAVVAENAPAVVCQTSTVRAYPGNAPVQKNKDPVAIVPAVSADDQPTQTVFDDIQGTETKVLTVKSIPGPVETAVNAIGFANNAMTQLDTINTTFLQPLTIFNTVVSGIANVHPYAQMALSALGAASKMILSQANLDASIADLVYRIKQTYELILENRSPAKINSMKDILVQIAQVVQECAQFISRYSDTKSFCTSSPALVVS
ncbi:hypothetical protein J3A83DRAFT_1866001 [Scleroderma citrinum]